MCFTIRKGDNIVKVAQKDIVAFKVLKKREFTLQSPVKDFKWIVYTKYSITDLKRVCSDKYDKSVHSGFHALRTYEDAKKFRKGYSKTHHIYQMIVPKGSLYWINATQIVSDGMKLAKSTIYKPKKITLKKKAAKKK